MSEHGFSNIFQISNLNKGIIATVTSRATFAYHAMDQHGSEHKSPDFHALRHNSARAHPSSVIISPPFLYAFPEKQKLEEKSRLATVLQ